MIIPPQAPEALAIIRQHLPGSLVAVYLHGSAVVGGLRPRSDVDLLAVVDQPLAQEAGKLLATDLMRISGRYPHDPEGRRPLELIVFQLSELVPLPFPARCGFIYGEWLREAYEEGRIPGATADPEFTLVLAQSRKEAVTLFGPEAEDILPDVPEADVRRAMAASLPSLMKSLAGDERNVLLTLARIWHTLVTGEFIPKDVAAEWAINRLPPEHAPALARARRSYVDGEDGDWLSHCREILLTAEYLRDRAVSLLKEMKT